MASCCPYFEESICFRRCRAAILTQLRPFVCRQLASTHPPKPVRKYPEVTHLVDEKRAGVSGRNGSITLG